MANQSEDKVRKKPHGSHTSANSRTRRPIFTVGSRTAGVSNMKALPVRSQWHVLRRLDLPSSNPPPSSLLFLRFVPKSCLALRTPSAANPQTVVPGEITLSNRDHVSAIDETEALSSLPEPASKPSRTLIIGAVSLGVALIVMGMEEQKALALGPEGPLVEEFWDNVRRYALYALTVSTGALYTIFQPIVELLRNPISAVLVIAILAGTLFLMSQVLSAMTGISELPYDYAY